MACRIEINDLPVLTSCPPDNAQILLFNVTGYPNGMALLPVSVYRCCLLYQMFGVGVKTVLGEELVEGIYQNTGLVGDFYVFANFIARFLVRGTEWDYVRNDNGVVVGFEIFDIVNYDDTDEFIILPNPTCSGTPAEAFPEGINEPIIIPATDFFTLDWTTARRAKYGAIGNFQLWQKNGDGVYEPTGVQPTFEGENPSEFIFPINDIDSYLVIS